MQHLNVAGENTCGTGPYSAPFEISRYLPEVTLEPFDTACINWPAFELTGGMPTGGTYSGDGIDNGWFDPETAGLGEHTITYTYSDPNFCENFASQMILVDACTGIANGTDPSGITIYPNPTSGTITIDFGRNTGVVEISVMNTLNKVVYTGSLQTRTGKTLNIDLSNFAKGLYFVRLKYDTAEEMLKVILQ